jgi:hypothetical protein
MLAAQWRSPKENAEAFIAQIVTASQITPRRRRDVERELRAHIEDLLLHARDCGHDEREIGELVRRHFGNPSEIARAFEWVYRRERAAMRLGVFAMCTAVVAALAAAGILAAQTGVAAGFGMALSLHHTAIEVLDILATVAVYVAMTSAARAFPHRGLWTILAAALVGIAAWELRAGFLAMGCANALFLRLLQGRAVRWGAAPVCFGAVGLLFWLRSQGAYPAAPACASWMTMGLGYQAMTDLAARVDRALWHRLDGLYPGRQD